jgi:hypothetical protein
LGLASATGGRFEVFKRGYFPELYKYDLHSAYPHVMRSLPDLDTGYWRLKEEYDEEADLAFVLAKVESIQSYIQPLHYKIANLVTFPHMKAHYRILTKPELDLIADYNLATVKVVNGWHFYDSSGNRPFEMIKDLYDWRKDLKSTDDPREHVIKILMNSIYGKTIQIDVKRRPNPTYRVGNLFLPVYASQITAKTRTTLIRECLERDISPIAFFTDAIVFEDPVNLKDEGLGTWSLEKRGEGVILGSGVYTIRKGEDVDTKLRGFKTSHSTDLFKLLEANKNKTHIPQFNRRPVTLGELVHRFMGASKVELNHWMCREKRISVNFDRKRIWERDFGNCSFQSPLFGISFCDRVHYCFFGQKKHA